MEEVRLYLLGTCMGVILQQRNTLCLHASGVVFDDQVILFTGESGVGKSTTLSYFYQKGYKVLGDDTLPIKWINNQPFIVPSAPDIKLWKNSIEALEFGDDSSFKSISPEFPDKFRIRIHNQFERELRPLKKCILLDWKESTNLSLEALSIAEAAHLFRRNTYRSCLLYTSPSPRDATLSRMPSSA